MSPTRRTLLYLRKFGYLCAAVEKFIPKVNIRRDLFGFADVFAVRARPRTFLLVQCTSIDHLTDRVEKVCSAPALRFWLAAGGRVEVWGWFRNGRYWHVHRIEVKRQDKVEAVQQFPR